MLTAMCSSDLIAILRGGPYSAVTQLRDIPSWSSSGARGDFLGANSCAPASSQSPWECINLSLVPRTWFAPERGPLMGRICPKGLLEVAWVLHKSGYSSLVLGIWPWSHLSLLFITVLRYWGPSWCIGGWHHRRLNLATPYPGDALSWRPLFMATPYLGDAWSGQPVDFPPWAPWMGPTISWLRLWLTPEDETVH